MKFPWRLGLLPAETLARACSSCRRFSSSVPSAIPINRVTRSNFESVLEELRAVVREADFVAVDLEMTGITSAPWREAFEFDRSDVRYLKVKDSAEKFAVLQFGVCPFRWDSDQAAFVAQPHNFYVFPRKELPVGGPSKEFLCQTTSIDFLVKYKFDFNACIHQGISYLSRVQEAEALHALSLSYENEISNLGMEKLIVSTSDILFTERMKIRLRAWRERLLQGSVDRDQTSAGTQPQFQTVFYKVHPAILLNGFISHQLRLLQLVVEKYFEDLVFIHVTGEDTLEKKLVVYTDSYKDKCLLMKEVEEDLQKGAEARVNAAVGFRHIIDLLVSEKKLVVGHNCFLDMAHVYSKFFGPLPSSIKEFASCLHQHFPYIIDTKHLMKADRIIQGKMMFTSTSLSAAFGQLCPQIAFSSENSEVLSHPYVKVQVQAEGMRSSSWNTGDNHEAGYDAFMTGCLFAQICSHLGVNFKNISLDGDCSHWTRDVRLQKYINFLYLGWNSGSLIDLRTGSAIENSNLQTLKKRYAKIIYSNIVLIWGFPIKLKSGGLRQCINKAFGPGSVVSIYYLDDTAAFIQFSKEKFVSDFLKLKEDLNRKNDPLSVLHPLAKLLEGANTHVASYEAYKQIVCSPISKFTFAEQAQAACVKWNAVSEEILETDEQISQENPDIDISSSSCITVENAELKKDRHPHLSTDQIVETLYVTESQLVKIGRKQCSS